MTGHIVQPILIAACGNTLAGDDAFGSLVARELSGIPGISVSHVEATYLTWIDLREREIEDPVRFFEAAGVGLSGGSDFGLPGFVRLNFGCPRSLLAEALGRMRAALGC